MRRKGVAGLYKNPVMEKFQRKKPYKAVSPDATISEVRRILDECDIFVSESGCSFEDPGVYSCHLRLSGPEVADAEFAVNGKGMSPEYALASAYGELMERMQNFLLFGDYGESVYRLGLTKHMAAPDEVFLSAKEAIECGKDVLLPLMRLTQEQASGVLEYAGDDTMPCVPFYNVLQGGTIFLPHKTLRMTTGSNGMAAGNTFREAMIQGMSELYERAAVREAYLENRPVPQLRPEAFEGTQIYDRLINLKSHGYNFQILDLSMGKGYPVVGLRLERGGAAAFKAGADPCPETALERCLTEIFQGTAGEVNNSFKRDCCPPFPGQDERTRRSISAQALSFFADGSGRIADNLFHPSDKFTETGDFECTAAESDETDLEFLLDLTKRLGYSLYVRDWSFLGFPACQIIIPEISNYEIVYEMGEDTLAWSFSPVTFRPDRTTEGCARIINALFDRYEKNVKPQNAAMFEGTGSLLQG